MAHLTLDGIAAPAAPASAARARTPARRATTGTVAPTGAAVGVTRRAGTEAAAVRTWLDLRLQQLAAWAEAQPPHHRLGAWLPFGR